MEYIPVLSIAGSDCCAGAGLQADLKTISALGGYALTAVTAVTVQNTRGVTDVLPMPPGTLEAQFRAVVDDIPPQAIKIGMLTDEEQVDALARCLDTVPHIPVVLDPVLVSSSGRPLLRPQAVEALRTRLLPRCTLLTPNLPETERLSGIAPVDDRSTRMAAGRLLDAGCRAVLVKGGHRTDGHMTDVLVMRTDGTTAVHTFDEAHIPSPNTHGTGCTLSSAIATFIALGRPLPQAVEAAKAYLTGALRSGRAVHIGHGHGPLNHFFDPHKPILR